jgi:hypothetical protein
LTLHFDRISVLSLSKKAALPYPAFKGWLGAPEWVKKLNSSEGNPGLEKRPSKHTKGKVKIDKTLQMSIQRKRGW